MGKNMQITVPQVDEGGKTVLFLLFSLPSATETVIAEREALFTWDDKSMNHLFQHYSAFAVPLGYELPFSSPPSPKTGGGTMESFRPEAKLLCAGVMILLSLSLRHKPCVLLFVSMCVWFELCGCIDADRVSVYRRETECTST